MYSYDVKTRLEKKERKSSLRFISSRERLTAETVADCSKCKHPRLRSYVTQHRVCTAWCNVSGRSCEMAERATNNFIWSKCRGITIEGGRDGVGAKILAWLIGRFSEPRGNVIAREARERIPFFYVRGRGNEITRLKCRYMLINTLFAPWRGRIGSAFINAFSSRLQLRSTRLMIFIRTVRS